MKCDDMDPREKKVHPLVSMGKDIVTALLHTFEIVKGKAVECFAFVQLFSRCLYKCVHRKGENRNDS